MNRRRFAELLLLGSVGAAAATRTLAAPEWPQWPGTPSNAPTSDPITLSIDYAGAAELLAALVKPTISDADVDRLLLLEGVAAMVDNVTRYLRLETREEFRKAMKAFPATHNEEGTHFNLEFALRHANDGRTAMAGLKTDLNLTADVTAPSQKYRLLQGPFAVKMHCVAAGVSDNFTPERDEQPEFFTAVDRSQGDLDGLKLVIAREIFRAMERTTRSLVSGLTPEVFDRATAAPTVRLLTAVLDEGMATYVVRDMALKGDGPLVRAWRDAYLRQDRSANFATFDKMLAGLRDESIDWDTVYDQGLAGVSAPLHFVGYQMAHSLEGRYGRDRVLGYFQEHPAVFFRDYADLWHKRLGDTPEGFNAASEMFFNAVG